MGYFSMTRNDERTFPGDAQKVFHAVATVAGRAPFSRVDVSEQHRGVTSTVGLSAGTWGQTITAVCEPGPNGTTVRVRSQGQGIWTFALYSRNGKLIRTLLDNVQAFLANEFDHNNPGT